MSERNAATDFVDRYNQTEERLRALESPRGGQQPDPNATAGYGFKATANRPVTTVVTLDNNGESYLDFTLPAWRYSATTPIGSDEPYFNGIVEHRLYRIRADINVENANGSLSGGAAAPILDLFIRLNGNPNDVTQYDYLFRLARVHLPAPITSTGLPQFIGAERIFRIRDLVQANAIAGGLQLFAFDFAFGDAYGIGGDIRITSAQLTLEDIGRGDT